LAKVSWSVRARASSMTTATWSAKLAAAARSVSVKLGLLASRPSSSAPRTCSPTASRTTISGPVAAPSAAAAAARRSPVTRLGWPVRIACPVSEPASGAVRFAIPAVSSPATPVTMTWSAP
jgi:hypothetical protein